MPYEEVPYYREKVVTVELPCSVGDTLYFVNYKNEIEEVRVSMLTQKANKMWKIRLSQAHGVFDVFVKDVGKFVFFTREDAQRMVNNKLRYKRH